MFIFILLLISTDVKCSPADVIALRYRCYDFILMLLNLLCIIYLFEVQMLRPHLDVINYFIIII